MDPLMLLMLASLKAYCLKTDWDLLMVNCFSLIKALN